VPWGAEESITVLLCVNSDGTNNKHLPNVVGKAQDIAVFYKHINASCEIVCKQKVWMTTTIFTEF
jgi:hypothetical protein